MPCIPLVNGENVIVGMICMAPTAIKLMRGVWMEFHDYLGPTFWRDKHLTKPIYNWVDNPRIVEAFDAWMRSRDEKRTKKAEAPVQEVLRSELPDGTHGAESRGD